MMFADCGATKFGALWVAGLMRVALASLCVAWSTDCQLVPAAWGQDATANSQQGEAAEPGGAESQQSEETSQPKQAWEYWAYRVRVWLVTDQSPIVMSRLPAIQSAIESRAFVVDSASWNVEVVQPTPEWNWELLQAANIAEQMVYLAPKQIEAVAAARSAAESGESPSRAKVPDAIPPWVKKFSREVDRLEQEQVDKLIVVRVSGQYQWQVDALEYDLRTRTWGARNDVHCVHADALGRAAFASVANAFMPLARIEKAFDKIVNGKSERRARVRVRALGLANEVSLLEDGSLGVVPNSSTPVRVRPEDVLKPVIRRVDRELAFESARVVDWTYLLVDQQDGSTLECRTRSKDSVPLSGRTGTRIDKLALVIRPPRRSTQLQIVAKRQVGDRNFEYNPLADYEVFSRRPDQPSTQSSELLGKTDVFGRIGVPPAEDGIRILYVRSGYRPLARLPIIPGLEEVVVVELPNDEDRLYAEGIVRSLRNRVTDLLAHRKLLETQIKTKLEQGDLERAEELFEEFEQLEDATGIKGRIINQRSVLLATSNESASRIEEMFTSLLALVEKFMPRSQTDELRQMVQRARNEVGY